MTKQRFIEVTVQRCCGSCKHFTTYCEKCGQKLLTNYCSKVKTIVVESQLCELYDGRDDMLGIVMEVETEGK